MKVYSEVMKEVYFYFIVQLVAPVPKAQYMVPPSIPVKVLFVEQLFMQESFKTMEV